MRLLALTHVFPSSLNPGSSPYILRQCEALAKQCELRVLGPLPWYPGASLFSRFSHWGEDFSRVPESELISGLRIEHPRFLQIPRWLWPKATSYALSLLPSLGRQRNTIDAILATWAYPDAVAAVALGELLRLPVFVQVVGSDIDVLAELRAPKLQLRWALPRARGVIAVSRQLGDKVRELGAAKDRVFVIPTGVDRTVFKPRDRAIASQKVGADPDGKLILFVGRLHPDKGLSDLLTAFDAIGQAEPRSSLVIIGDGPLRTEIEARAQRSAGRLKALGELGAVEIADWLAAAYLLALPSYHEGTPNVILEALSSGRKVVATSVGGIPDLITSSAQGELVPPRDPEQLKEALLRVLAEPYAAEEVLATVDLYDWHENARRVLAAIDQGTAKPFNSLQRVAATIGGGGSS